ncbi:MAG: hypothetical protein ACI3YT_05365 [Prevotella sp.]
MKTLFTITSEELQRLKDNVNKAVYLKEAEKELSVMPQTTDASQLENWRKDCENRMKRLSEKNEMLRNRCKRIELIDKVTVLFNDEQRNAQELVNILKNQLDTKDKKIIRLANDVDTYKQKVDTTLADKRWVDEKNVMLEKENNAFKKKNEILEMQNDMLGQKNEELENENNMLNKENKSLKEKISELEALYASGFAGSAVVENAEGAKVVNSDAARENEAYKKKIEKQDALINDLSNRLKNKSIPMSSIIDGFRKLAQIDSKDAVSMVFKSLCTMFSKCTAWTNSEEEILKIFVGQNTPAPGTVNNYYGNGANHYDYHRELTLNKEDNKSIEKK